MRRIISHVLYWLSPIATVVAVSLMTRYANVEAFQDQMSELYGFEDEAFYFPFLYAAAGQAALVLLAYLLSLDPRAKGRPWLSMTVGSFSPGATAGFAGYMFAYQEVAPLAWLSLAGGGLASMLLILGFEFFNRWLWQSLVQRLDKQNRGGAALLVSRLALLWRPGQTGLLQSVSIELFRRGARGEVSEHLRQAYQEGKRNPDLLEVLCQLAAEEKQPKEYLRYLKDLFDQFPDDDQLRDAYLEELLEQGLHAEALAHMEEYGVHEDEVSLERYANLLLASERRDAAVEVAKQLGEIEGIPMRRADAILRKVLADDDKNVAAMNQLADWAARMARRDQQVRWLESSISVDPRQTERALRLADLLEETEMTTKLEDVLETILKHNPSDLDIGLRHAQTVFGNGKLQRAADLFEGLEKDGCQRAELYVDWAEALFELSRLDRARKVVDKGLENDNLDEEDQRQLENLAGKIERAVFSAELSDLMECAAENPEDLELQFETMEKLALAGHFERAVAQADLALASNADAREDVIRHLLNVMDKLEEGGFPVINYVADLQVDLGKYDDALESVKMMADRSLNPATAIRNGAQKILRRSPHHLRTLFTIGELYRDLGQFTEMIHSWSLYLANGGEENEEIDRSLANAYMSLNDFDSARRFINALLEMGKQDEEVAGRNRELLIRAIPMAVETGHATEAANYQKKLEIMAPGEKDTKRLRKVVNEAMGKERFQFLKTEIDSGKADGATLEELGDLCLDQSDFNQAITYYQRATRQKGAGRIPRAKLAYAFCKKRMFDLGGETLAEISLSLEDDPEELENLMAWIYRTAEVLEEAHMYSRANKIFKQIMKIDAGYRDVIQRVERLSQK